MLDLAMLEKGGETDTVVGKMRFLANDGDIVLTGSGIEFEEFFSVVLSENS